MEALKAPLPSLPHHSPTSEEEEFQERPLFSLRVLRNQIEITVLQCQGSNPESNILALETHT